MKTLRVLTAALAASVALSFGGIAWAETGNVRIADQFGLSYLPVYVALKQHLFQKRFEQADLNGTKVSEIKIASGAAANNALLSGSADLVLGGLTGMFIFHDKTYGTPLEVRGAVAICDSPIFLNTINPRIKSIKDLTAGDRVAMTAARYDAFVHFSNGCRPGIGMEKPAQVRYARRGHAASGCNHRIAQ